jgi:hypothetical protein
MGILLLKSFPLVQIGTEETAYGGSQDWFYKKMQRDAGCASVSAANIAACYDIGIRPDRVRGEDRIYVIDTYMKLMEEMYGYMTPGPMGFPDTQKYQYRFLRFAAEHGRRFRSRELKGWKKDAEALQFIREALTENNPVAILVLTHRAPEMRDNTWHWMTISGYDDEKGMLILSNYGKKETQDAAMLLENHPENRMTLVSFTEV